ncbi:hypothetical protein [Lacticaseibacillus daqingensis]|uniref:hypothetical protein n=1 Tax=Lacticaseibacillus daqingensis TaxID=2486014 RepID=UPI000F7A4F24|nr:hypothetical protein [Lacticaseibacillus daqingensis]
MENHAHTLQAVTQNLIRSTRDFFELTEPVVVMPQFQLQAFAEQAHTNHYRIAAFFTQEEAPLVGHLTRQLADGRYLLQAYRSNVVRVVSLTQLTYLQRVD